MQYDFLHSNKVSKKPEGKRLVNNKTTTTTALATKNKQNRI